MYIHDRIILIIFVLTILSIYFLFFFLTSITTIGVTYDIKSLFKSFFEERVSEEIRKIH